MEKNKYNILTDLALGEGQFIEFKESFDKSISKEIVAFTNASGGIIYLGITDTGKVKGIEITNKLKSEIQTIARNCDPPLNVHLTQMDNVLVVDVKEGVNKPYACSFGFYIRMGANAQKMKRDEILSLAIKSGKIRFDEQICAKFDWNDFDDEKLYYYLQLAGISNTIPKDEILKNLRVLTSEGMTNAGVLYFAKQPHKYIGSSRIRCVHFNDDERIDILDKKEVDKGIIGNIEFAVAYLKERVPVRIEINGLKRDEYPEYPLKAYREAIVNAVVHFDYYLGDTIAVEKLKNSIVINNKGELLFPISDFGKRSEARNRLLVDLLARTDFMEKAGTGIKRLRDECKFNGNVCDFHFTDAFWITIESNRYNAKRVYDYPEKSTDVLNEEYTGWVTEKGTDRVTEKVTDKVTDNQRKILFSIKRNKYITTAELAVILGISQRKVKENIAKLKGFGLVERIGSAKGGYWLINE